MPNETPPSPPYLLILGGLMVGLALNIAGLSEKLWPWFSPAEFSVSEDYFLFNASTWNDGADAFDILLASMSTHRIMLPKYFTRSPDFFRDADQKFCSNLRRAKFWVGEDLNPPIAYAEVVDHLSARPNYLECEKQGPVQSSRVMLYTIRNLSGEPIHGLVINFARFANGTELIEWDDEDGLRIYENNPDCLIASVTELGFEFALQNTAGSGASSFATDATVDTREPTPGCLGHRGPDLDLSYPGTLAPGEALMVPIFTVHYPRWISENPQFEATGPFIQNEVLLPLSVTTDGATILESSRSMAQSLTLYPYVLSGKG